MEQKQKSKQNNKNKQNVVLNFVKDNVFTLILIILLAYMQITGSYVHEKVIPVPVEVCEGNIMNPYFMNETFDIYNEMLEKQNNTQHGVKINE